MSSVIKENKFSLLVLGGGKRVGLVRAFKSAAEKSGYEFSCIAYENSEQVPLSQEAEIIVGLNWDDPRVLGQLIDLVHEKKIDWVCACVDKATLFLDEIKMSAMPNLITSSKSACENVLDKVSANVTATNAGLAVIPNVDYAPLFAKPRQGSASNGAGIIETNEDLIKHKEKVKKGQFLYQKICSGKEYTVDCFATKDRIFVSPRVREQTLGGEVIITRTVSREDIVQQSIVFIKTAKVFGPLTIQFIEHEQDLYFMECNPRFGGGVLCSIKKGFDYPYACISAAKQKKLPEFFIKSDVVMSRYFAEVYFEINN